MTFSAVSPLAAGPRSVGPTLRPVFCVIESLHRDRGIADLAVAGRFLHAGVELELGRTPDWITGGLPDDEEWRIEWIKFYEGLDLAAAFSNTGDRTYLTTWEDLVEAFCDQVPVGHDSSDASARRLQNWIYAWQRFRSAPAFDSLRSGLAARLVDRIEVDAAHLSAHLTPERNHRTLELYTLLLVGLATGRTGDADRAMALLAENAVTDIWADGVHRECSSDYHCIVLRSLVGAIVAARASGLSIPDSLLDRVDAAATVAMHLQRPNGVMPALSDGDEGDFRSLLRLAADVLDRDDLRWVATQGSSGRAPDQLDATFAIGGYLVQRSGWGSGALAYDDEAWAVLDCGPLGDGGHGHYDQLSIELYAKGRPLAVDPGRFTYADDAAGWRRRFKGTEAHNTVMVDGLDQVRFRRGKPKGALPQARLVRRASGTETDIIVAQATSPSHDVVHTRTVTFERGPEPQWRIEDRLEAPTLHRYELRWHLPADAWNATSIVDLGSIIEVRSPGALFTLEGATGAVRIDDGWVSPTYGVRLPAPVIVVSAEGERGAVFVTWVVPC